MPELGVKIYPWNWAEAPGADLPAQCAAYLDTLTGTGVTYITLLERLHESYDGESWSFYQRDLLEYIRACGYKIGVRLWAYIRTTDVSNVDPAVIGTPYDVNSYNLNVFAPEAAALVAEFAGNLASSGYLDYCDHLLIGWDGSGEADALDGMQPSGTGHQPILVTRSTPTRAHGTRSTSTRGIKLQSAAEAHQHIFDAVYTEIGNTVQMGLLRGSILHWQAVRQNLPIDPRERAIQTDDANQIRDEWATALGFAEAPDAQREFLACACDVLRGQPAEHRALEFDIQAGNLSAMNWPDKPAEPSTEDYQGEFEDRAKIAYERGCSFILTHAGYDDLATGGWDAALAAAAGHRTTAALTPTAEVVHDTFDMAEAVAAWQAAGGAVDASVPMRLNLDMRRSEPVAMTVDESGPSPTTFLETGTISITTPTTDTTVGLTVTAATSGTAPYSYQWHRSTTSGFWPGEGTAIAGGTGLTLNDEGLTAATVYYYRVVSTDADENSVTSPQATVTTEEEPEPELPQPASMAVAHTALTDGAGETEVPLFGDSTELPKTTFDLGDVCFWGINTPQGVGKSRDATAYGLVRDAGIKGIRQELPWYGLEQKSHAEIDLNWYGCNSDISQYYTDGMSIIGLLAYTPGWANGCRSREYGPQAVVEEEEVTLTDGAGTLAHEFLLRNPWILPADVGTTEYADEVLTEDFTTADILQTAHTPVKQSTVRVWVDEGAGYVEWTRGTTVAAAANNSTTFWCDHHGRIYFRDGVLIESHGKIPTAGSTIKATYSAYNETYTKDVDYSVNLDTGGITQLASGVMTITRPSEPWSGPTLDAAWTWSVAPSWSAFDGGYYKIQQAVSGGGEATLLQDTVSEKTGDFAFYSTLSYYEVATLGQVGIILWQDADNYLKYYIRNGTTNVILAKCSGGTLTEPGKRATGSYPAAPQTISCVRTGDTFDFALSNPPDGNCALSADFAGFTVNKIGMFTYNPSGNYTVLWLNDTHIDAGTDMGDSVLACYDYLDTTPWAAYVTSCVAQWKDKIRLWETWNEPSEGWCWAHSMAAHAAMHDAAVTAILAEDANAKVVAAGWADGAASNLQYIYDGPGAESFDYAAWHPYPQLATDAAPTEANWLSAGTNAQGRAVMVGEDDTATPVMLGELSTRSARLLGSRRLNDRVQAEDGIRMLLLARKAGYVAGIQWWPGVDLLPVANNEDGDTFGDHDGLFYNTTGYGGARSSDKPMYYAYKNVAQNTGMLIDLGSVQTVGSVVLACADLSQIAAVSVKGSLTCTDAASKPPKVCAVLVGGTTVFAVTVATGDADLVTEAWTATCNAGGSTFAVVGSVSGAQGTATKEVAFESTNGVCSFTIPAGTYTEGQVFEWETFAGDGFTEIGTYARDAEDGAGNITVDCGDTDARYLRIDLTREEGESVMTLTQVDVLDDGDANISDGCLYSLEGWQEEYMPA